MPSGNVFIQAQKTAGSDLELVTDHRRLLEALPADATA